MKIISSIFLASLISLTASANSICRSHIEQLTKFAANQALDTTPDSDNLKAQILDQRITLASQLCGLTEEQLNSPVLKEGETLPEIEFVDLK